ncbi:MAG: hypothetical protein U0Y10_04265 [Spirosomataceae bacterium]
MWIEFNEMPATARVWVYQASENLDDSLANQIQAYLKQAVSQWAAHGQPLTGSAHVLYNRFLVVAVDESFNMPSGCSIDASAQWLKSLESQLGISFFDRSIAFLKDGVVQTIPMLKAKQAIAEGLITPDMPVFNPMVTTWTDFQTNWKIPAAKCWLKKHFANVTV